MRAAQDHAWFVLVREGGTGEEPRPERSGATRKIGSVLADSEIKRVLVVAAHPDDVDFSAAGTVAGMTDAGIDVTYCIVTDGDAGGFDESIPRADMAPLRRKEQTAAAHCVGVHDLRFLGYPDGRVEATLALRRDLARVIRQVRPDRLLCPSAERNYLRIGASHPDHRAVGSAALDAVYPDARNPFAFPELLADEGLAAWTVREVWVSASPGADHYVDVTDAFPRKIAALRAHESQTGHMDELEDFLRGWMTRSAALAGLPEGRLAEAFQVLDTG
jgi:LmbE family N-acetylglucosaminyl deacetylase